MASLALAGMVVFAGGCTRRGANRGFFIVGGAALVAGGVAGIAYVSDETEISNNHESLGGGLVVLAYVLLGSIVVGGGGLFLHGLEDKPEVKPEPATLAIDSEAAEFKIYAATRTEARRGGCDKVRLSARAAKERNPTYYAAKYRLDPFIMACVEPPPTDDQPPSAP